MLQTSPARERILKVIRRQGLPDRVPVELGIGPWYACKLLNATTIDLVHNNPSAQEVMLEAYKRYQYDPWLWATGPIALQSRWIGTGTEPQLVQNILCDTPQCYHISYEVATPFGSLAWQEITEIGRPTIRTELPIKNPETDWIKYRYWIGETREYHTTFTIDENIQGKGYGPLGFQLPIEWWEELREGRMISVTNDIYDKPDMMDTIFSWYTDRCVKELNAILKAQPREALDAIFFAGSASSLSYSSLDFFKKYDLPFLKKLTRMAKAAGVPSHLHVCGRSFAIVELCYQETDLDIIHPLEPKPGGDCDLQVVKKRVGEKLILMGNLNTFDLLAFGTVEKVKEATRRCLEQAMEGGRFWLATGDQTPANTPEENLLAIIETVQQYGKYSA